MRWVKWIERSPTRGDTDDTLFVLTKRIDSEGELIFDCNHYRKAVTPTSNILWLEGASRLPDVDHVPPPQSVSHVRKVEL